MWALVAVGVGRLGSRRNSVIAPGVVGRLGRAFGVRRARRRTTRLRVAILLL